MYMYLSLSIYIYIYVFGTHSMEEDATANVAKKDLCVALESKAAEQVMEGSTV